ncbi:PilC/PilY family type IV pilus protein [Kangiella sediminilitoris]|uniref:von Willebrand factor type A n=1 Tax=Kangiella sediminilitoris TaxID=1144748 RepID=A0A1B3BBE2_9GAMM|nr:PilC/PilY family type IV pilus protein [Kangiella sediminilitoris]AOE50087.1 von Willebrand factor type A [Kangiella sediminilitoris]
MMIFKKLIFSALIVFLIAIVTYKSKADDTEIYFGKPKPVNVLLVLDVSGSMAWTVDKCNDSYPYTRCYPRGAEQSRLEVMKDALNDFINELPSNVKIGILTYSSFENIDLLHEVKSLNEGSHKADLLNSIKGLEADGGTLAAGAIYEAARYFRGEYGNYDSPIELDSNCGSASNIVFLTDGQPNSLKSKRWRYYRSINSMLDGNGTSCAANDDGKDCTEKLATFMSETEQVSSVSDSIVKTHTIAFADDLTSKDFLKNVAQNGKGLYNEANDRGKLVEAFKNSIKSDIEQSMLVTPSVPLSRSNRLSTTDELFLALFKPEKTQFWPGNLKKYYFKDGNIVDKNDVPAITDKQQFVDGASSAWSIQDGNDVTLGGIAQNMTMPRKVFTNLLEKNLWTLKNRVETDNNKITRSHLGLPTTATDAEFKSHIKWLYDHKINYKNSDGEEVEVNRFGDLLHSQPVAVQYEDKSLLFVGDNDGFLHAINGSDTRGKEEWAFIPRQLLKNTSALHENQPLVSVEERLYGLDGDIAIYHQDKDKDGIVNNGEKVYLYVGMRRGGKHYYGLDISVPNNPQLMFTITGDKSVSDEVTAGLSWDNVHYYEGLAETWSKPFIGHIKWRGGKRLVMIFGGGYDSETQDNAKLEAGAPDSTGNNIFIADAVTGSQLWNARTDAVHQRAGSIADTMTNSFAADIAAGDLRGSGTIEHFYASDVGGQLFRFDVIQEKSSDATTIQAAKIADIQGSGVNGNRRFFTKPDISFIKLQGETIGLVALGSGYRAHPLNEDISDRFYLFYDKKVMTREFEDDVITEATLYNVTEKVSVTDPVTGDSRQRFLSIFEILADDTKNNGWYLTLSSGEKVLSDSSTINYRLFFTTYSPSSDDGDVKQCSAVTGQNKLYAVSVLDGKPAYFRDAQPGGTIELERSIELVTGGIAPPFSVFFPINDSGEASESAGYVGLEKICGGNECDFLDQMTTVKWRELTGKQLDELRTE